MEITALQWVAIVASDLFMLVVMGVHVTYLKRRFGISASGSRATLRINLYDATLMSWVGAIAVWQFTVFSIVLGVNLFPWK